MCCMEDDLAGHSACARPARQRLPSTTCIKVDVGPIGSGTNLNISKNRDLTSPYYYAWCRISWGSGKYDVRSVCAIHCFLDRRTGNSIRGKKAASRFQQENLRTDFNFFSQRAT